MNAKSQQTSTALSPAADAWMATERSRDSDLSFPQHAGVYTPTPEHTDNRAMVRCLSPLHIQGFAFSCFAWVYVFTDYMFLSGWINGGPSSMVYNWLFAALGTSVVTLSLAEVASACPMIGGLYYFSARLAPQAHKGFAGFMTAGFNIMGVMTSLPYVILQLAQLIATIRYTMTYDNVTGTGQLTTEHQLFYFYMGLCLLLGILASAPSRVVAVYCSLGMFTNLLLFFSFSCTILFIAPTHQPAAYILSSWDSNSAATGITSSVMTFLVGCNMSVNTFSGYDAVIYMTEECIRPTFALPLAMWRGFLFVSLFGLASVMMMLFSIQRPDRLLSPDAVFGGVSPVSQLLWDVMEARFQSGRASAPFMALMAWSMFLINMFLLIGASRKVYAMSRDRLVLGSRIFAVLDPYLLIPLRSTWVIVLTTMLLGLSLLADDSQALFSIFCDASLPLTFCSYLLPIAIGLFSQEKLQPGPWDMGRWGPVVRTSAVLYLLVFLFISMIPQSYPTTLENFPYTAVMWLACTIVMLFMWYCPKLGKRNFYSGPVSATAGSLNFAITSQTLRQQPRGRPLASLCMCTFQDMVTQRAHRKDSRRSSLAESPTRTTYPGTSQSSLEETHPPASPEAAAAAAAKAADLRRRKLKRHSVFDLKQWLVHAAMVGTWLWELLPAGSGMRMPLRIPGENEALSRAQKLPIHPAGYAWDKEASKRLGHREVRVEQSRRSYGV